MDKKNECTTSTDVCSKGVGLGVTIAAGDGSAAPSRLDAEANSGSATVGNTNVDTFGECLGSSNVAAAVDSREPQLGTISQLALASSSLLDVEANSGSHGLVVVGVPTTSPGRSFGDCFSASSHQLGSTAATSEYVTASDNNTLNSTKKRSRSGQSAASLIVRPAKVGNVNVDTFGECSGSSNVSGASHQLGSTAAASEYVTVCDDNGYNSIKQQSRTGQSADSSSVTLAKVGNTYLDTFGECFGSVNVATAADSLEPELDTMSGMEVVDECCTVSEMSSQLDQLKLSAGVDGSQSLDCSKGQKTDASSSLPTEEEESSVGDIASDQQSDGGVQDAKQVKRLSAGGLEDSRPKTLFIGDSNVVRFKQFLSPVPQLQVHGRSGARWDNILHVTSVFSQNMSFGKIFVFLGINDVFSDEEDGVIVNRIQVAMENFAVEVETSSFDRRNGKRVIYVMLPPVVYGHHFESRMEMVRHTITVTAEYFNEHRRRDIAWLVRGLNTIYNKDCLTVAMFPKPMHLTPFGYELLLDELICDINDTNPRFVQVCPVQRDEVFNVPAHCIFSRRYLSCNLSVIRTGCGSLLQQFVNRGHLVPECFVSGITFERLFRLRENPAVNTRSDQSLNVLCMKLLPEKLFRNFSAAVEQGYCAGGYEGFANYLHDELKTKFYGNSNYCFICFQDIDYQNNCFSTHIMEKTHRLCHVVMPFFRLGEECQLGNFFDRLAAQVCFHSLSSAGIRATRNIVGHKRLFPGLHFVAYSSISFQEAVYTNSQGTAGIEVDVGHVGNLPALIVTVQQHDTFQPVRLHFRCNISLRGSSVARRNFKCNSAVVFNRSPGQKCHVLMDRSANDIHQWSSKWLRHGSPLQNVYDPNEFLLEVDIERSSSGLVLDLVQTYVGVAMRPLSGEGVDARKPYTYHACISFLIGTRVLNHPVPVCVRAIADEFEKNSAVPGRVFTFSNITRDIDIHADPPGAGSELTITKVSFPLYKLRKEGYKMLLKGAVRFYEKCRKQLETDSESLNKQLEIISDQQLDVDSMNDNIAAFSSNLISLVQVPDSSQLRSSKFWNFFATLFAMQILDYDSQDPIEWLAFGQFQQYRGSVEGRMCINVMISGANQTLKTKEGSMLNLIMKVNTGTSVHQYLLPNVMWEFSDEDNTGELLFEEVAALQEVDAQRLIERNKDQVSFFYGRDMRVPRTLYSEFVSMMRSDRDIAGTIGHLSSSEEEESTASVQGSGVLSGKKAFVDMSLDEVQREMCRKASKPHIAEAFEAARLQRDRFLAGLECLFPGVTGSFGSDERIMVIAPFFTNLFSGTCQEVMAQHGKSIHKWIKASVCQLEGRPAIDSQGKICSAQGDIENCTCSIQPDDISSMLFARILSGFRLTILEGPVGCGKTYTLCQTVVKLLEYTSQMEAKSSIEKTSYILTPTIFLLSTTNSNVENIKQCLVLDLGMKGSEILHLVAKSFRKTCIDDNNVHVRTVPTLQEESDATTIRLLRRLVSKHRVILSTVDLMVQYASRLRLVHNTYIFLDEASQVSILLGSYLLAYSDFMVVFGDTYQTEPYLDVQNSLMKVFNVTVSFMEFALKAFAVQGKELFQRHVVRTFFNWRSTKRQCDIISRSCYAAEHPLFAVHDDLRIRASAVYKREIQAFGELFGDDDVGVTVLPVHGSMYTLPSKSHWNIDEANVIFQILDSISKDLDYIDRKWLRNFKVAVLTLYDGMNQLIRRVCEVQYGGVPSWLEIVSVRVAQGRTYSYVIFPLIESHYGDEFVCPEVRNAFTADSRLITVAISRQSLGLIIVCDPIRYILDSASPISSVLECLPNRGIFYSESSPFSATIVDFLLWFYNLNILGRRQWISAGDLMKLVKKAVFDDYDPSNRPASVVTDAAVSGIVRKRLSRGLSVHFTQSRRQGSDPPSPSRHQAPRGGQMSYQQHRGGFDRYANRDGNSERYDQGGIDHYQQHRGGFDWYANRGGNSERYNRGGRDHYQQHGGAFGRSGNRDGSSERYDRGGRDHYQQHGGAFGRSGNRDGSSERYDRGGRDHYQQHGGAFGRYGNRDGSSERVDRDGRDNRGYRSDRYDGWDRPGTSR